MKRKIYWYMIALTLACMVAYAAASTWFLYGETRDMVIRDVQEKAELITTVAGTDLADISRVPKLNTLGVDIRVTVISPDGKVLFDNFAEATTLENHANREEFQEAERDGVGESTRYSHTQGSFTYYYSLRLSDGSVLRLSKTIASVQKVLIGALPMLVLLMFFVFALGNVLASRLAKSILRPLRNLDPERDAAVYDELAPLVRTIMHQKENITQQQQDLSQRADLTHSIVENMQEALVVLDHRGKIIIANASAQKLFRATREMVGCNVVELARNVEILDNVKAALSGKRCECRITIAERVIQAYFDPAPNCGVMSIFMDVTEKAKAEQTRAEFSANVSHELKTPLTSIYGYAQMLHNGIAAPQDTQRFAGVIETETLRLIQLVEDIMKLSQLDETTKKLETETVDLVAVAQAVSDALASKAAEQGITVCVEGAAPTLNANRAMVYEMLFNLVDNAIKYNKPAGSVRVNIGTKDGKAIIEVIDTGVGIPQEDLYRIFERFYRVDKSRSKKVGGTGLGLAIVKHVVQIHGGTVDVWSEEEKGTKVTVKFALS